MEGTKHVPPNGGLALFVLVVYFVVSFVPVAQAHTDFESSDPAAGAVVESAVSEIKLRFTASSLVAGEGFLVLPPAGDIIAPEVRVSADQREFTLRLDPPRAGGEVRVQRSVRAGDAHPIEGTFRFTIRLPATPAPRATTAPTPDESSDGPDVTSEPHARTKRGG